MYTWCTESTLCLDEPGSEEVLSCEKGDINRKCTDAAVQTLQGSRKLHHLSNVPGSPYELLVKKLTSQGIVQIMITRGSMKRNFFRLQNQLQLNPRRDPMLNFLHQLLIQLVHVKAKCSRL
jgi:hypothetical protein